MFVSFCFYANKNHFIANTARNFEYGNGTESAYGCGATFQNEFWYFGGNTNKRQVKYFYRGGLKNYTFELHYFKVSKIVGCKLELQTLMNFDFYLGACNTFNQSDPLVLLCFDRIHSQECHT